MFSKRHAISILVLFFLNISYGMANAEEALSEEESRDRFTYNYYLETLNLQAELAKSNLREKLFSHFTGSGELVMLTLDRSASKEAHRGLAYLILVQLDGVVSRDRSCAILNKGKSMLPYLKEVRTASENGRCTIKQDVEIIMVDGLCQKREKVTKSIDEYIESIKNGEKC